MRSRSTATSGLRGDLSFLLARANALSLAGGNAALRPFGLKVRSYSVLALAVAKRARRSASSPSSCVSTRAKWSRSSTSCRRVISSSASLTRGTGEPNVVMATPAGHRRHEAAQAAVLAAERSAHSDLTEEERVTLAGLLQKMAFAG